MTRARTFALLVLLAVASASVVQAVDLQVEGSEGTTEALIPGLGWRRAVLGRSLPPGTVLTTWVESSVTISAEGIVVEVAPLTHVSLGEDPTPGLSLSAGRIAVQSEGAVTVSVPIRNITVESAGPVQLVLTSMDIRVDRGEARVVFSNGVSLTLTADQSISLVPHDLVPIIPRK